MNNTYLKKSVLFLLAPILLGGLMLALMAAPGLAAGNVSTCDEASLDAALAGGGLVTFSCDGIIPITTAKNITTSTTIDGSGQTIVLSGTTTAQMFTVNQDIDLTFKALTIQHADFDALITRAPIEMLNGGTLTYDSVTVKDSSTRDLGTFWTAKGAGVSLTVNITGSTFINNHIRIAIDGYGAGAGTMTDGDLNVNNSLFTNNSGTRHYGGVFLVNGASTAAIDNSQFISNTTLHQNGGAFRWDSSGLLTISNSEFKENSSFSLGGAVYNGSVGDVTVSNTDFISNTSNYGGGIYSLGPLTVTAASAFTNNDVAAHGGAIYVSGSGAPLNVSASHFESNKSDSNVAGPGAGGAIYAQSGSVVTISNTDFLSNTNRIDDNLGGAVGVYNNVTLSISGSMFQGNSGNVGGAVGVWNSSATITNTQFYTNSAGNTGFESRGGALYHTGSGTISVNGSHFEGNSSVNKGGAWYSQRTSTVEQSSFVDNTVTGAAESDGGGAIYNDTANGDMSVTNVTFSGNDSASDSGAIETNGTLRLLNSTIADNTAVDNGGGIGIGAGSVYMTNTIVANNTGPNGADIAGTVTSALNNLLSNAEGGVVDGVNGNIVSATPALDALTSAGNGTMVYPLQAGSPAIDAGDTASAPATDQRGVTRPQGAEADIGAYETQMAAQCWTTIDASTVYSSTDSQAVRDAIGAAVNGDTVKVAGYCAGVDTGLLATIGVSITLQGGYTTTNWTTSNPTANPTTLDAAQAGQVLYISNGLDVTVDGLNIINGSSSFRGGGIQLNFAVGGTTLTVTNSYFENNYAADFGGAIDNGSQGLVRIQNTTFISNTAAAGGAGITINGGSYSDVALTVTDSRFENNDAQGNSGGAISIWGGSADIDNTDFISNSAPTAGAIHAAVDITVANSSFSDNTAENQGGALYGSGDTVITNSTFAGNSVTGTDATDFGGAIFNGGDLRVSSSIFDDNSAVSGGGTIVSWSGTTVAIENSTFMHNNTTNGSTLETIATTTQITNSTFYSNTADRGAGVGAGFGTLTLVNNTFSDNFNTDNTRGTVFRSSGTANLVNNIIANTLNGVDCAGASSSTNDLIEDGTCAPAISADPILGAMETTGLGGTGVLPLQAGSPAIDTGNNASAPAADQRGVARPQGCVADIGAYEAAQAECAALSLNKTAEDLNGGSLNPGDEIEYTITVTNELGIEQAGIVITDAIPANTTYVAGSASVSQGSVSGPDPLVADIGALASGASATLTFRVTVNDGSVGETIQNSAQAASPSQGPPIQVGPIEPPGGGAVVPSANALSLAKVAVDLNGGSLNPGDEIEYTITVTNELGIEQAGIVITDAIPANTTYVAGSASVSQGSVSGPDPLVADIGALASGASATLTFRVTVDAGSVGETIQNSAQAASPSQGPPIQVGPIEPPGGGGVQPFRYYFPIIYQGYISSP